VTPKPGYLYPEVVAPSRWGFNGEFWCGNSVFVRQPVDYRAEDLPVGCAIFRDYANERHWVHVVPPVPENERGLHRYVYHGERYRSLSGVVRVCAPKLGGWSGNRFFGLRRKRQ